MEVMEAAKVALLEMIESAGENGVTEGEAVEEVMKRGCFGYYEIINSLKNVYQKIGLERTEPHTRKVICYYKPKKEPEKETTKAIEIAMKSAHRATNERATTEIINNYRR